MVESTCIGLSLPIATCGLEKYGASTLHVHRSGRSKRPEEDEEESATSAALTVESDCTLTSTWSETPTIVYYNTYEVFSVLIDG